MVTVKQIIKKERDAITIGGLGGYIAFLITSSQGFNFNIYSVSPGILESFTTNAQQLVTIQAIKPALVFILIGIAISYAFKRWILHE